MSSRHCSSKMIVQKGLFFSATIPSQVTNESQEVGRLPVPPSTHVPVKWAIPLLGSWSQALILFLSLPSGPAPLLTLRTAHPQSPSSQLQKAPWATYQCQPGRGRQGGDRAEGPHPQRRGGTAGRQGREQRRKCFPAPRQQRENGAEKRFPAPRQQRENGAEKRFPAPRQQRENGAEKRPTQWKCCEGPP